MKNLFLITATLYFSFGFIFAVYAYSQDVRTFQYGDVLIQHTYNFTTGIGSFKNPDPERCVRRSSELRSIATIPFFTVFGVPILIARGITGNN